LLYPFQYIFEHLGELLSVLIKLEEIIQRHPVLVAHWKTYVQTVKLVHHNPDKFGADPNLLKPLEMVITKLNGQLFSGFIFLVPYYNCTLALSLSFGIPTLFRFRTALNSHLTVAI